MIPDLKDWEDADVPFEMVEPFEENDAQREPESEHNAAVVQRRLSAAHQEVEEVDENAEDAGEPFNMFTVHITGPMNYDLTEDLVQRFIERGAFRIEDGSEDTHGPIYIQSFELRDLPEQEAFEAPDLLRHTAAGHQHREAAVRESVGLMELPRVVAGALPARALTPKAAGASTVAAAAAVAVAAFAAVQVYRALVPPWIQGVQYASVAACELPESASTALCGGVRGPSCSELA